MIVEEHLYPTLFNDFSSEQISTVLVIFQNSKPSSQDKIFETSLNTILNQFSIMMQFP